MDPSSSLARFIRFVMRDVTYHKLYPSTVMAQVGDSLSVLPDNVALKGTGLTNVPIRTGIPGTKATVAPGAKCLLGFEEGDPQKPYVALWGENVVISLAFANGVLPIARQGDSVIVAGVAPGSGVAYGTIATGNPLVMG